MQRKRGKQSRKLIQSCKCRFTMLGKINRQCWDKTLLAEACGLRWRLPERNPTKERASIQTPTNNVHLQRLIFLCVVPCAVAPYAREWQRVLPILVFAHQQQARPRGRLCAAKAGCSTHTLGYCEK